MVSTAAEDATRIKSSVLEISRVGNAVQSDSLMNVAMLLGIDR